MSTTYVELRAHTAFSFGSAACTPEALVTRAAALGYSALGLTDTADLGGVVRFAIACQTHGICPIAGVELMVDGAPLALLARNATGFAALGALITQARSGSLDTWRRDDAGDADGTPTRGQPTLSWSQLAARSAGLWLLTGPTSSRLAAHLVAGRRGDARHLMERYRAAFGACVAVEVQLHSAGRREATLAGALVDLAEAMGMPWVVTGDPRYLDAAGRGVFDVLTALRQGVTLDEAMTRGLLLPNDQWALQDPAAMAETWAERDAGIAMTRRIADDCTFELGWVRPPLPTFPIPPGYTIDTFLREQTFRGAHVRWGETLTPRQVAQLDHELGVIGRLGFDGFFLTMWDAVREARARGILCQGRGSAANSAVTYCLGITAVDPVRHGLLFERFLSEARVTGVTEAPDIDLDVEHDRREELLDYMYATYGRAHAAITAVTQVYSASTAVQDVCRAYGVPTATAFALSKRVHALSPAAGAEHLRQGLAAAHGLDVTTPRGEGLLAVIAACEGLPRFRSTHPGGFVLSSAPLGEHCPVEPTTMGRTIIQFDKDDLDLVGIPKYDFLGLGSLAAVRRAFDVIERETGDRPELYTLPPDDPATFALIAAGDTIGTFQIESRAQIASLVNTRPERLYDLVAQVALIRPGPIVAQFVHPYTERRRGRAPITYPEGLTELLRPILDRTMGIPIFQEQGMALSMAVAGYTAGEADELRRTMGHARKQTRLTAALEWLRGRMVERGIPEVTATQLTDDLRGFANYGFPESHAWSFALIAYATAWLKATHPTAFYIGLLNAQPMGFYSVATLVHDARRHGVEIRMPDLVHGAAECTAERSSSSAGALALRAGWRLIRALSTRTIDALGAARMQRPFTSIADVVRRAALTRADVSALTHAHAFAAWVPDRRQAGWEALRAVGDVLPLAPGGELVTEPSQSATSSDGFVVHAMTRHEAVAADYRAVGLSTAGHPTERYRNWAKRIGAHDAAQLVQVPHGERVIVVGLVTVIQRPQTAKGVVFLLLEDEAGSVNIVCWPSVFAQYHEAISHSAFLAIYGRAERDGGLMSVIARRILTLGSEHASDVATTIAGDERAPGALHHTVRRFR